MSETRPERATDIEPKPSVEQPEILPAAAKEMTAEERRQNREQVGGDAVARYLNVQEGDAPAARELKEQIAGQDLEETIGMLLDTKSPTAIREALDELGISRSTVTTRDGRKTDRWRLENPDPAVKETIPGSFAKEEHLKAFVTGFAAAETFKDKVRVVHEVYRYLGLPAPELEELVPEEPAAPEPAGPETPEAVRPPAGRKEPVPLSKWKSIFDKLKANAQLVTLAVGLATVFSAIGPERRQYDEAQAAAPTIEQVDKTPRPSLTESRPSAAEAKEAKEQLAFHIMKKGDTVDAVVKRMLGEHGRQDQAMAREMVKKVLELNGIKDAGYRTEGHIDSTKMAIGSVIDVGPVAKKLGELKQAQEIRQDLENGQ